MSCIIKNSSSVEYGIKKIFFLNFCFYRGLSRFKFCVYSALFFKFSVFLTKILPILLNYLKIVNSSVINFMYKDRGGLLSCLIRVNWLEFLLNFSKFRFFSSKMGPNFRPLALNLLHVDNLNLRAHSS